MGVKDTLKSDAMGALGNIERAVIRFPKVNKKAEVSTESSKNTSSSISMQLAGSKLNGLKEAVDSLQEEAGLEDDYQEFEVQFNPSTIHISAVGGGNVALASYGTGSNGGLQFQELTSRVDVSMKLIFDAVNNKDAFTEDKLIAETGQVAKGVVTAVMSATGTTYSVQPQIEGFHAAMRVSESTEITFAWGGMAISGALTRLNSRYTMFSPTGNPIRAEAMITITCDGDMLEALNEKYQSMFSNTRGIVTQNLSQLMSNSLIHL